MAPFASLALTTIASAQAPAGADPVPEPPVPVAVTHERMPVLMQVDQEVEFDEPSEDAFGLGQRVIAAADVADNAFLMGQEVRVDAPVGGDLFVLAETVRISAPIGGDVYGAGGELLVEDRGSIGGNVFVVGGLLRIEGPVAGDVSAAAGRVVLDAPIGGDVELEVGELTIREGAAVGGTLVYESPKPAEGVEGVGATDIRFTQAEEEDDPDEPPPDPDRSFGSAIASFTGWTMWSYLSKLFVGFTFLLLGGRAAGRLARVLIDQPGRTLGLGFVVTCVLPVASALAIVLIVPLPLGVLGLLALATALYGAQLITAQAIGDAVLRTLRPHALGSPYISMAVGLVPLVLVAWVPWLGVVAWLAASIAGIGALWLGTRDDA